MNPTMAENRKDPELDFVLRYYQEHKFNTQKSLRTLLPARRIPLWRKVAVAAALLVLVIGGVFAFTAIRHYTQQQQPATEQTQGKPSAPSQTQPATAAAAFHFDNTPLPVALDTLGRAYGTTLTATSTDNRPASGKRLTGDFEGETLEEIAAIIEQVLDVKISIDKN